MQQVRHGLIGTLGKLHIDPPAGRAAQVDLDKTGKVHAHVDAVLAARPLFDLDRVNGRLQPVGLDHFRGKLELR